MLSVKTGEEKPMNNKIFLYEENGFTVSKLNVLGSDYFIIEHKASGKRYIRKSLAVVDSIVRNPAEFSDKEGK